MKIASAIITGLGMVVNFLYFNSYATTPVTILIPSIGFIIGIFAIVSLVTNNKSTAIGVLTLIFTSLLGGIFYLCWKPDEK